MTCSRAKCQWCHQSIAWLKTAKGKNIPVDYCSWLAAPQEVYDPNLHVNHFANCKKFMDEKRKERHPPKPPSKLYQRLRKAEPFDYISFEDKFFVCLPDYPVTIQRQVDGASTAMFSPPSPEQIAVVKRRNAAQRRESQDSAS